MTEREVPGFTAAAQQDYWQERAVCRGSKNPAWLDSQASEADKRRALNMCNRCPVIDQCRRWYYQYPLDGVMAGKVRQGTDCIQEPLSVALRLIEGR